MNRKNRVVLCSLYFIVISLVSGCSLWNQEENLVPTTTQQAQTTEHTAKEAPPKEDLPILQPSFKHEKPLIKTPQQITTHKINNDQTQKQYSKKRAARRKKRRRKEKTESDPKNSILDNYDYANTTSLVEQSQTKAILPTLKVQTDGIETTHTEILTPIPLSDSVDEKNISKTHTVEVRNAISVDDLAVKHWTGMYKPTKLVITVNNIPFTITGTGAEPLGVSKKIAYTDNQLTVHYDYEFLNGVRKGSDTVIYRVDEKTKELPMRFSWDTEWHVDLDGAQRN